MRARWVMALMFFCTATLSAQGTHVVVGTVTDHEHRPVRGASVWVESVSQRTSTDSLGAYRVERVPTTEFSLQVRAIGFKPVLLQGLFARDSVTVVNVEFDSVAAKYVEVLSSAGRRRVADPGHQVLFVDTLRCVAGVISDSTGAPLLHATVFIPNTKLTTTTDSTGHYRLAGFASGEFSVRAQAQDFRPKQIDNLKYDGKPLVVNITLYPFIELRVGSAVAPFGLRR